MKNNSNEQQLVLAVDPMVRGFAFTIMEGSNQLIDWGIKKIHKDKNRKCLERITEILGKYQFDSIILEDYKGKGSRRCLRVQQLIQAIHNLAAEKGIATYSFSRDDIKKTFSQTDAFTKHAIATKIAKDLPQLGPHLPPPRKIWLPESDRINIFDAASLALTFFHLNNKKQKRAA